MRICIKIFNLWDFSGGPVARTSPFNIGGAGSIPGQRVKIPHAEWQNKAKQNKTRNIKYKQCCNNEDLQNGPH